MSNIPLQTYFSSEISSLKKRSLIQKYKDIGSQTTNFLASGFRVLSSNRKKIFKNPLAFHCVKFASVAIFMATLSQSTFSSQEKQQNLLLNLSDQQIKEIVQQDIVGDVMKMEDFIKMKQFPSHQHYLIQVNPLNTSVKKIVARFDIEKSDKTFIHIDDLKFLDKKDTNPSNPSPVVNETVTLSFEPDDVKPETIKKVLEVAHKKNMDPATLLTILWLESRMGSDMKTQSTSASGPFQFLKNSWIENVMKYGADNGMEKWASKITKDHQGHFVIPASISSEILKAREDIELSASIAVDVNRDELNDISIALNKSPELADIYLVHLLGKTGAMNFLTILQKNPNINSRLVVGAGAKNNPRIFFDKEKHSYLSVQESYARVQTLVQNTYEKYNILLQHGDNKLLKAMMIAKNVVSEFKANNPKRKSMYDAKINVTLHPSEENNSRTNYETQISFN